MNMNYVNYWLYQLGDVLPVDGDALPLSGMALARLALDDGVQYALVLSGSLAAVGDPQFEVVNIVGLAGGGYILQRGQEGTAPREWPAGTLIMAPLTVAGIEELKSSVGAPGASAYEVAVANGFVGTESEWLASLEGEAGDPGADGADGASAYQIALANGFTGSEVDWLASLEGAPGDPGSAGASAYQVAVANGFVGTQSEWLSSLKGADGAGLVIIDELSTSGDLPLAGSPGDGYLIAGDLWLWVDGAWLNAGPIQGPAGHSAYQVAVANGFVGTEAAWLASLQGENGADGTDGANGTDGEDGAPGASAYQIAVANGFVGTEAQWLASLASNALGLPSRTVTASGAITPADAGHWLICNSATPITLTIGAEATGSWAIPGILPMFHVLSVGAGTVTIAGEGFTIEPADGDTNVIAGYGHAVTALWRASDVWNLIGRTIAA